MGPKPGTAKAERPESGPQSGAVAPAWVRIAILAALLGLVVYTFLFTQLLSPAGAHLPFWAATLLPIAPPAACAGFLLFLLLNLADRAEARRRALIDAERRFRSAVEAARCGVWEWDLEANRVYVSDRLAAMLGLGEAGEISSADFLARVDQDQRLQVENALKGAAEHGAFDVAFRAVSAQVRPVWINARGQAMGARGPKGYSLIVGVALDVSDERLAQARAQAAEMRLRDAIESASEAFAVWDRAGRLLLSNDNFRSWFGLDPRVLKPGAQYREVMKTARSALVREVKADDGAQREAETREGRWIQISERRTGDGGMVMTAADVTTIKRQEEARARNEFELEQLVASGRQHQTELSILAREYETEKTRAQAANRAKSEFLANMSHELRTPLNAINGFSEIMAGEMFGPLGDERYREYARDIFNSGQHLLALINDVLDMAKIEAGKLALQFGKVSIEEVVFDAQRLMRDRADAAGLQLDVELDNLPEVRADARALKQILLNLLSNAVKFTPRGGKVLLRGEREGDWVRLTVRDTGIGISPGDLKRLARPFEQIESQQSKTTPGTGLGLALTRSLVEMHGGRFELTSEPGLGTSAVTLLPIRGEAQADQTAA